MREKNQVTNSTAKKDAKEALLATLGKIKHKIFVMSGKGGVGKTSTCVNLALSLSWKGFRVGVVDVDLHGPDIPRMLGLRQTIDIDHDGKIIPLSFSENLKVISIESMMTDKDHAIIWRGPFKYAAIQQMVGDVKWGELDFLLIDAPPGTGDEPLTVAQTIRDAKAVVVTTPQEVSLADVRKAISFCRTVKMDMLGIIENMSGLSCPHCHCDLPFLGNGGGRKLAEELSLSFLGQVPFDQGFMRCMDEGNISPQTHERSLAGRSFSKMAENICFALDGSRVCDKR